MNDQLPNGFLVGDRCARHPIPFIHRPEDLAFTNFRGRDPSVDSHLHRGGYRDGAESASFPTRSGMTQRPARCWIRSISRPTSSARRIPHEIKSAGMARSRFPFKVEGSGGFRSSLTCCRGTRWLRSVQLHPNRRIVPMRAAKRGNGTQNERSYLIGNRSPGARTVAKVGALTTGETGEL